MPDTLSEVLRELQFRSARYIRFEMTAPWQLQYELGGRGVHLISRGRCELFWPDEPDRTPLQLDAGDLVVVPNGARHALRSAGARSRHGIEVGTLIAQQPGCPVSWGQGGEATTIVCGRFELDTSVENLLLRALPNVIRIPGRLGEPAAGVQPLMQALVHEIVNFNMGSELLIARLSDALVVHAIRHYASDPDTTGWLAALRDERLGPLLAELHRAPSASWTVERMAEQVGMSRAGFAARFAQELGEGPSHYLTRVRMARASRLLQHTQLSIGEIADQVGYSGEPSFSAAFRKWVGTPPAAWRLERSQRISA